MSKLIINFVCYIDEEINDRNAYMEYLFQQLSYEIVEQNLKYKILKMTIGLHEQATRPHFHLFVLCDTQNAKIYKSLNEKIQRILNAHPRPIKQYFQKINISHMYEGEKKKFKRNWVVYDESAMRYPFKEGNNLYMSIGYEPEEIKILRNQSINEWNQAQQIKAKFETQKQLKQEDKMNLESFINNQTLEWDNYDTKEKVKHAMSMIIEYCVERDESFNISQLKNKAINILRKQNKITTSEIIELIYI